MLLKERYKFLSYLRAGIDFIVINSVFFIAYYLRFNQLFSSQSQYLSLLIVSNLIYLICAIIGGIYDFNLPVNNAETRLRKILKIYSVFIALYFMFIVLTRAYHYSRIFHFYFLFGLLILLGLAEITFSLIITPYLLRKLKKNVILLGAGLLGKIIYEKLKNLPGYNIIGFLDDDESKATYLNGKYLGKLQDFETIISQKRKEIDETIITVPLENEKLIQEIINIAERNFISVKIVPSYHKIFLARKTVLTQIDGVPVVSFRPEKLSYPHNKILKRIFDIIFSIIVLLTIFPIFYVIFGILIKLSSPGPVLFKQKRTGYKGKPFICYKFRTMKVTDPEISDKLQATPDDPRKTKIGNFLRKTNLDEFPQFINVLRGEMSVVGPRPHPVYLDEKYQDIISEYNARFFAKPGITGWAQVNGYRGETRNPELMRKRVEHDIWYIENWSFWLDIKIIFLTILRMIKGDPNAY